MTTAARIADVNHDAKVESFLAGEIAPRVASASDFGQSANQVEHKREILRKLGLGDFARGI